MHGNLYLDQVTYVYVLVLGKSVKNQPQVGLASLLQMELKNTKYLFNIHGWEPVQRSNVKQIQVTTLSNNWTRIQTAMLFSSIYDFTRFHVSLCKISFIKDTYV